jgi:hypothetical protein
MTSDLISSTVTSLFRAVLSGNKIVRRLFAFAILGAAVSITFINLPSDFTRSHPWLAVTANVLGVAAVLTAAGIGFYQHAVDETQQEKVIERVEQRVREHPHEPQAAWELARIKLESYLSRNLAQVRWIFILTVLVMLAGFAILSYGIFQVYQSPENFKPSVLVTLSGVIVEFVAATFLLIYRSTMEQARDYVNILERINAVGMSVQILDSIQADDTGLRDKTRGEIAHSLLSLYGNVKRKGKKA